MFQTKTTLLWFNSYDCIWQVNTGPQVITSRLVTRRLVMTGTMTGWLVFDKSILLLYFYMEKVTNNIDGTYLNTKMHKYRFTFWIILFKMRDVEISYTFKLDYKISTSIVGNRLIYVNLQVLIISRLRFVYIPMK